MSHEKQFYIDGQWVDPIKPRLLDVIDPSTEEAYTQISIGSAADVDKAVAAAQKALVSFGRSTRQERIDLLQSILAEYNKRRNDVGDAISREMGAPLQFAREIQAGRGTAHLERMIEVLKTYPFESVEGTTLIAREPIGVYLDDSGRLAGVALAKKETAQRALTFGPICLGSAWRWKSILPTREAFSTGWPRWWFSVDHAASSTPNCLNDYSRKFIDDPPSIAKGGRKT